MIHSYQAFAELIKVSIGNEQTLSIIPTSEEWKMLFVEARKHCLLGICFAGVSKIRAMHQKMGVNTVPQSLYLTWLGLASKIMQRNEEMTKQCVEVQNRFKRDGFDSFILKGQGVEASYPSELRGLRQSGDIDLWVIGKPKSVLAYIEKWHPLHHCDYMHTHFDYFKNTEVEVHYRPWISRNLARNCKLQQLAREYHKMGKLVRTGSGIVIPTNTFQVIHVLNHVYWHLLVEGVGLRQMLDLYFVIKSLEDKDEVMKTIKWIDLEKFARAAMWVLGEVFGMKREGMLCEPSETEGRFLLEEIMKAGNFGKFDSRIKHTGGESRLKLMRTWMKHSFRLFKHYPKDVIWNPIGIVWLSMRGRMIRI